MKTVLIMLITLTTLFSQELSNYSRAKILAHAFENAESLKQIEAEMAKVKSMRKEYNGKAFPTIEGSAGFQHAFQRVPLDLGIGDLTGASFTDELFNNNPTIDPTDPYYGNDLVLAGMLDGMLNELANTEMVMPKNSLMFELALYQPIFAQGKVSTGIKIAKIYEQTIHQQYRDAQFAIAEDITGSYNLALVAQKNVAIQEEALELAQASHELAVRRFQTGKGSALDTLNSRFYVQEAIYKVRDAKKNHRLSMQKLFTAASLEVNPMVATLSDTLTIPDFHLTYAQAEELMMQHNSTILLLELAEELQAKMTKLAKTDFLPMLVGGASIAKVTQFNSSNDMNWYNDGKLFASLTVPIFAGGQRFQKVKQARLDETKLGEKKSEAIRMMHLALIASFEEYEVALAELEQTKELTELSKEGFRISTLSFEVGQITQLDLSRSQNQYNMAQLAYYNALYTLQVAVTKIERLIGEQTLIAEAPQLEDINE